MSAAGSSSQHRRSSQERIFSGNIPEIGDITLDKKSNGDYKCRIYNSGNLYLEVVFEPRNGTISATAPTYVDNELLRQLTKCCVRRNDGTHQFQLDNIINNSSLGAKITEIKNDIKNGKKLQATRSLSILLNTIAWVVSPDIVFAVIPPLTNAAANKISSGYSLEAQYALRTLITSIVSAFAHKAVFDANTAAAQHFTGSRVWDKRSPQHQQLLQNFAGPLMGLLTATNAAISAGTHLPTSGSLQSVMSNALTSFTAAGIATGGVEEMVNQIVQYFTLKSRRFQRTDRLDRNQVPTVIKVWFTAAKPHLKSQYFSAINTRIVCFVLSTFVGTLTREFSPSSDTVVALSASTSNSVFVIFIFSMMILEFIDYNNQH